MVLICLHTHDNENKSYLIVNLQLIHKQKFQMLEQNNFALSEFVQNKKAESNYEPIKNKVGEKTIQSAASMIHFSANQNQSWHVVGNWEKSYMQNG